LYLNLGNKYDLGSLDQKNGDISLTYHGNILRYSFIINNNYLIKFERI